MEDLIIFFVGVLGIIVTAGVSVYRTKKAIEEETKRFEPEITVYRFH